MISRLTTRGEGSVRSLNCMRKHPSIGTLIKILIEHNESIRLFYDYVIENGTFYGSIVFLINSFKKIPQRMYMNPYKTASGLLSLFSFWPARVSMDG